MEGEGDGEGEKSTTLKWEVGTVSSSTHRDRRRGREATMRHSVSAIGFGLISSSPLLDFCNSCHSSAIAGSGSGSMTSTYRPHE